MTIHVYASQESAAGDGTASGDSIDVTDVRQGAHFN